MSRTVPIISGAELGLHNFRLLSSEPVQSSYEYDMYSVHRHDYFSVFLIIGGSGKIQIDFHKYSYTPNTYSFFLIAPGQIHGWLENESDEPFDGYLLMFSKDMLAENKVENLSWPSVSLSHMLGENPFYSLNHEQAAFFHDLFRMLEREQTSELKNREIAVRNYLQLLLIEIDRINEVRQQQTHREEAAFQLTKQYLALVESHFRTVTQISDYAAKLFVTTNHLIESIKRTLGKSAGEVLHERQMLEAKRLLRYSSVSVDEIATHLGYKDPSYFGRLFKKIVGLTPTSFRNKTE